MKGELHPKIACFTRRSVPKSAGEEAFNLFNLAQMSILTRCHRLSRCAPLFLRTRYLVGELARVGKSTSEPPFFRLTDSSSLSKIPAFGHQRLQRGLTGAAHDVVEPLRDVGPLGLQQVIDELVPRSTAAPGVFVFFGALVDFFPFGPDLCLWDKERPPALLFFRTRALWKERVSTKDLRVLGQLPN